MLKAGQPTLPEPLATWWANTGTIQFDPSKPDGTPRKLMDSSRLNHMGWQAKIGLQDGPKLAYQDFLTNQT